MSTAAVARPQAALTIVKEMIGNEHRPEQQRPDIALRGRRTFATWQGEPVPSIELAAAPIPSRSSCSASSTSRSSLRDASVVVDSRSSWKSMIPTRSGGAIDLRSLRAAFSRRVTWGEPAPARRISSKARWTYASQLMVRTMSLTCPVSSRYRPSGKGLRASCLRMSCSRSIACTAVVGSWKGESASERSAMSTRSRTPYATSSSSVGSKLRIRASCNRSWFTSSGLPAHAEKRATRRNELAEGRDKLQQAVRTSSFLDKLLVADPRDHPGLPRSYDGKRVQLGSRAGPLSGYRRLRSVRVSSPTSSMSAETRSAWPMWCT